MNIFQLFSLSFEALKERRLRASLTTLMVVMGASLIVALGGTGNGFTKFINDQFSSLGANVLLLSPRSKNVRIDLALANEIEKVEGVYDAVPFIQHISTIVIQGKEQTSIAVGVEQTKLQLLFPTLSFEVGTLVSETDNIGVVLGNEVARLMDESGAPVTIGQTLKIKYESYVGQKPVAIERSFVIRGILNYIGSGVIPADQMVFISTSAAQNLFNQRENFDGLYVVTEKPELNERVRARLQDLYGSDMVIISPQMISDMIQQITGGVYLFVNVVAMVSLLVASVGIITTLQTSVMERIKEIGLLKALGFTNWLVLGLFLFEAMIIGIVGGGTGVLLGVGLSQGMCLLLGRSLRLESIFAGRGRGFSLALTPIFAPWDLISTWLLCIALSMISGFYPSWRASRLDPVVALRYE